MAPERFQSWRRPTAVPKKDGQAHLEALRAQCKPVEEKLREKAFAQMATHIDRAPPGGYLPPHTCVCRAFNVPRKARGARVDLDVWAGQAFVDDQS